jgi:hypothetical protein
MVSKGQGKQRLLSLSADFLLVMGIIVLILGFMHHTSSGVKAQVDNHWQLSPTLPERQEAQEQAISEGKKEYNYTTSFIPGIGVMSDPKTFLQQQEDVIKNLEQQKK